MEDDPVLKMYEALAIVIEKEEAIIKLERENTEKNEFIREMRQEKEEMAEKLRKLEVEKNKAPTAKTNLGPVWAAIKNLTTHSKQQNEEITALKKNNAELLGKLALVEPRDRTIEEQQQRRHNEELKRLEDRITALEAMPRGSGQLEQIRRRWTEQPEPETPTLESRTLLLDRLAKHENTKDNLKKRGEDIRQRLETLQMGIQNNIHFDQSTILIMGGERNQQPLDEMLILSPGRTSWTKLGLKLPFSIAYGGAVYIGGEIYILGGELIPNVRYKHLYKLNNQTTKWQQLADMGEERSHIGNSCLEWRGDIWVFGGCNGRGALKTVERYRSLLNTWTTVTQMKEARVGAAVAVCKGIMVVCGGSILIRSVECYDPESGVWATLNDHPFPLRGLSMVTSGENLIAMGGFNGEKPVNIVMSLCPTRETAQWQLFGRMRCPRESFTTAKIGNDIYAIGGWDKETLSQVEVFNEDFGWRTGPELPARCSAACSVVIPQFQVEMMTERLYGDR